jgi:uncharacterized protein (TIGR03435 family)
MTVGRVPPPRKLLLVASGCITLAALAGYVPVTVAQSPQPAPAAVAAATVHQHGDIAGDWQGTLEVGRSLRLVFRLEKTEKGWAAKLYNIDQPMQPLTASSVSLDGSTFKLAVEMIGLNYQGTLSADGNTIAGTWNQSEPRPFTLVRATKETAWEIPAPPPPVKPMAADADPSFDVATIKPNDSGATSMQGINVNGRNFTTRASSLEDLISFAYDVQAKQIIGAPEWISKDRYDIAAVPAVDGAPNPKQLKIMIQKLLADRFKLTFHHDKRELAAYVLTVGSAGQKLAPTQATGTLPGLGLIRKPEGLMIMVHNGTILDFTAFLQTLILDRPVVDQTALSGKFDFHFTFTPDDSEFNGHPPPLPAKTDTTEAAPDIFQAMLQQVGLKLTAEKTPVDVLAIDHVEKPSAN